MRWSLHHKCGESPITFCYSLNFHFARDVKFKTSSVAWGVVIWRQTFTFFKNCKTKKVAFYWPSFIHVKFLNKNTIRRTESIFRRFFSDFVCWDNPGIIPVLDFRPPPKSRFRGGGLKSTLKSSIFEIWSRFLSSDNLIEFLTGKKKLVNTRSTLVD